MTFQFTVNGSAVGVDAPAVTPLLWVIREELKLTGTKFGCGVGLCWRPACCMSTAGARFRARRRCRDVAGKEVTTIEGAFARFLAHPVQKAWLAESDACSAASLPVRSDR